MVVIFWELVLFFGISGVFGNADCADASKRGFGRIFFKNKDFS
jgi:hypothetical protein